MDFQSVKDVLEALSYLVVIGGVPVALVQFIHATRIRRLEAEQAVYDALDQRYLDYLTLCLENPDLDVFDVPIPKDPGDRESFLRERKETIAYSILLGIFERAYLMYRRQPGGLRKRQWLGWEKYLRSYLRRKNFRRVVQSIGVDEFDQDFAGYLKEKLTGERD